VIEGPSTLKDWPLLCIVPAVTTRFPLLAAFGTCALMLVFDQLLIEADCPLKATVPVVAVKFTPTMVIEEPGSALAGDTDVMTGATVNAAPPLWSPPLLTTTLPVVAPFGTVTTMLVSDQGPTTAA
jgi:hypothetical protein